MVCFIGECPGSGRYLLYQPCKKWPLHIKDPRGREHMYKSGICCGHWEMDWECLMGQAAIVMEKRSLPNSISCQLSVFSTSSSKLINCTFIIKRYPKTHACARSAKTLHCWAKGWITHANRKMSLLTPQYCRERQWRSKQRWFRFRFRNQHGKILPV